MIEVDFQGHLVKSVTRQGGYARKLNNRFAVGVPDLYWVLPGCRGAFAEVKLLRDVPESFSRKIDTKPKQRHELRKIADASGYAWATMVLVGVEWRDKKRGLTLVVVPIHIVELDSAGVSNGYTVERQVGNFWDMRWLAGQLGMER